MEAISINPVTERNITLLALSDIKPSSYNPRKSFDETSLAELSESIQHQGVLQPIVVRHLVDSGNYEIVFGEHRYRASLMAGLTEIPALVLDVSDETAEEMAVIENLQRKDVTPIEEANAYQKLIENGCHDIQSLAVQFSKSESYIRTRLRFTALIPEISALLDRDEINVSVASEICRYGEDIQREVYEQHFTNDLCNSWRGMKAADVAKMIERKFTANLKYYNFDKSQCLSCPDNTNNMNLFCNGGCGNCANRQCLVKKNTAFLVEKTLMVLEKHSIFMLGYSFADCDNAAVNRLSDLGYEMTELTLQQTCCPKLPSIPEVGQYNTEEEFFQAQNDYEQRLENYKREYNELVRRAEEGEIIMYIQIGSRDISMCYVEMSADGSDLNTPLAESYEQMTPLEKLEKQDMRNKEIALEQTVEDTRQRILEADITEAKFGADEDKMIYFFLLSSLRKEHFSEVGIDGNHLSDNEKLDIISRLTPRMKAIIRRDYLVAHFKSAFGDNPVAGLLLEFAQKHMPEVLADIKSTHNEVYEKRHQRIEEKKAVLLVKEKQKMENPSKNSLICKRL